MPAALIIRTDYTPDQLEAMAVSAKSKAHARRLRAIGAVLRGASRCEAAAIGGMQRQTLRDWVQRFNAEGPDGLSSRKPSGRPAKLSSSQKLELAAILGSPAAKHLYEVGRWRLTDIAAVVKARFGVEMNAINLGRILRTLGFVYDGTEWLPVHAHTSYAAGAPLHGPPPGPHPAMRARS